MFYTNMCFFTVEICAETPTRGRSVFKKLLVVNPSIPKAQEPENFHRKDFAEQISVEREKFEKMMEKVSRKQDKL